MTATESHGEDRSSFRLPTLAPALRRLVGGNLPLAVVALLVLAVSPAHALYLDLSDLRAVRNGQATEIEIYGLSITISPGSSRHPLSIGGQNEALTIVFGGAAVRVDAIDLRHFGRRDQAVLEGDESSVSVSGRGRSHNVGGLVTRNLTISGSGRRSNFEIRGLEISLIRPQTTRPTVSNVPNPVSNPVPEPTAALLFAAGLGIALVRARRS